MKAICYAMIGSGRASQLHLDAIKQYSNKPIVLKYVYSNKLSEAKEFQKKYGFEIATDDFNIILNDPEVNLVDVCTPPFLHAEMIKKVLLKDKNVICEKPLSGYFGNGNDSKRDMIEKVTHELDEVEKIVNQSKGKFMYAENFVYAPSIQKAKDIIMSRKSKILFALGEESLCGSSSPVAGSWDKNGGGSLIRVGIHPLSAIIYLKKKECECHNKKLAIKSIVADFSKATENLSELEHRHIKSNPADVEDVALVSITFSDDSKAAIIATDVLLGGSKNYVNLYCNDATLNCNLTLNDNLMTYLPDEEGMSDIFVSEMSSHKMGWNHAFVADEVLRGYANEMNDFIDCVLFDKKPECDFQFARLILEIIYKSYAS